MVDSSTITLKPQALSPQQRHGGHLYSCELYGLALRPAASECHERLDLVTKNVAVDRVHRGFSELYWHV